MPDGSVEELIHAPPELKRDIAEDRLWWALQDMEKLARKVRELQIVFGARLTRENRDKITRIKTTLDGAL